MTTPSQHDPRRQRIAHCCERLALATQRQLPNSEEAQQRRRKELDVYVDALAYLPIEAIEAAAGELCRTASRYPTAPQWREVAQGEAARLAARRNPLLDDDEPYCAKCQDTGMLSLTCDPSSASTSCGRDHEPGDQPHEYMRFCECRAENPVLAARRQQSGRTRRTARS